MTRRLPEIHDLESMRAALEDPEHLFSAFVWLESQEGHSFWANQAHGKITDEGRSALLEMISLAEAAELAAAA